MMSSLMIPAENNVKVTSRDIAEWTGKRHDHVIRDIRKELEALGRVNALIFGLVEYTDSKGEKRPCYEMNEDGVMQLALKYDAMSRYKVIQKLKELKRIPIPPMTRLQLLATAVLESQKVIEEKEIEILSLVGKSNHLEKVIETSRPPQDGKTAEQIACEMGIFSQLSMKNERKLGHGTFVTACIREIYPALDTLECEHTRVYYNANGIAVRYYRSKLQDRVKSLVHEKLNGRRGLVDITELNRRYHLYVE